MQLSDNFLRFMAGFLLSVFVAVIGKLQLHHDGTLRGIIGSFLVVTSIQILLWTFGVRTELVGTAPEPSANDSDHLTLLPSSYFQHIASLQQNTEEQHREILELRGKLIIAEARERAASERASKTSPKG